MVNPSDIVASFQTGVIIMPLVDIHVIKGAFTSEQKAEMIAKVTEAMVLVEGEKLRGLTWVKLNEVEGGNWAIGGQALTGADVQKVAAG
jgi:4-oxalocrotonate tautomerase